MKSLRDHQTAIDESARIAVARRADARKYEKEGPLNPGVTRKQFKDKVKDLHAHADICLMCLGAFMLEALDDGYHLNVSTTQNEEDVPVDD